MKKCALFLVILMFLVMSLASAEEYTGTVIAVTDSSTISVVSDTKSFTVRLNCAACPAAGQPFAEEAQKFLSDMILNRKVDVQVIWQDHDNRKVSKISVDGKDVGVALATAGLAWYDSRQQQDGQIAQAQAQAQAQKIGLWSQPNPVAPWTFLTNQRDIRPNTSGPIVYGGTSGGYGAPPASSGGDEGTSWDSNNQPLSTSPYYGGYYPSYWGGVYNRSVTNAISNRGSVSRGASRR